MTALQPRTWAEGDRVARVDRRAPNWHWRLGTVCALDGPHWVVVRWDDENPLSGYVSYQGADDANLVPADDVPIDERHWLAPQTQDQLVRQEATGQLRAMWAALPDDVLGDALLDIAHRLDGFDAHGGPDPNPAWAAASRALLNPAPTHAAAPQ
jgi:hypothetical protein